MLLMHLCLCSQTLYEANHWRENFVCFLIEIPLQGLWVWTLTSFYILEYAVTLTLPLLAEEVRLKICCSPKHGSPHCETTVVDDISFWPLKLISVGFYVNQAPLVCHEKLTKCSCFGFSLWMNRNFGQCTPFLLNWGNWLQTLQLQQFLGIHPTP